ncbi:hypothetical protein HPP92_017839 [Vanilla planifolia]|uniref:Uncharacterized protein n=1 Tax=Vanilla planifolia TaxID=51239 RepID=A0A835QAY0_VANPL|nr:hypothetical protein HPP92_017839 [Vanilla planifolia]
MAVHRKIQRWMENKENTQTGGADPGGTDRKNGEDSSSGTLGPLRDITFTDEGDVR